MATFKAEVQNKRADGTYNVRIRVTHNRVIRRMSTNLFVTGRDLTKSLKIKNAIVQNQCDALLSKCRKACNEWGYGIRLLSTDELVEKLERHLEGDARFRLDFIQYMRDKAAAMKPNTGRTHVSAINALVRFIGRNALDISEINVKSLTKFEAFLETEPVQGRKITTMKKGRALSAYIGSVRTMHNLAKEEYNDEDRGIIRIPQSPFKKFKLRSQSRTRKRAVDVELIQRIIDIPYDGNTRRTLAKDCFILSFALIGMNSVDMYYAAPLKRKVLIYNRLKTTDRRDDNAEMRVRVDGCIAALLEKYQDRDRLFNFHRRYSGPDNFNKAINWGLKLIGDEIGVEDLEFYAARHSWATIARSADVNIDKATVHEALNHVDSEMKVTDIYIDKDWRVIWNANERVLSLFDWTAVGYDVL